MISSVTNMIFAGTLSLFATDVQVKPLTGPAIKGSLREISAEKLVISSAKGAKDFLIRDLRHVTVEEPVSVGDFKPTVWLELLDGTSLAADSFASSGDELTARIVGGETVIVPTRAIRFVRFKKPLDQLQKQWEDILASDGRGDMLVVRKSPTSIDHLEGTLLNVGQETVKFKYQGSEIDAPREKLEGLVMFHPLRSRYRDPLCTVADVSGNRWVVKSLSVDADKLNLECASGVLASLSMDHLSKIDFSTGNVVFLSDLEADTVDWKPFIVSRAASERLTKLYQPKKDRSMTGGTLRLDKYGDFKKGLAIHSRTQLVYRLTDRYRRLRAVVGMDDRVGRNGNVDILISGDGKLLFEKNVAGTDEPHTLDLDITGVRRLQILVDYGKGMDIGDHLNLCDAMLVQ